MFSYRERGGEGGDFVLAAQTSITDKSLQDVSFYAYLPTTSHLDVYIALEMCVTSVGLSVQKI